MTTDQRMMHDRRHSGRDGYTVLVIGHRIAGLGGCSFELAHALDAASGGGRTP